MVSLDHGTLGFRCQDESAYWLHQNKTARFVSVGLYTACLKPRKGWSNILPENPLLLYEKLRCAVFWNSTCSLIDTCFFGISGTLLVSRWGGKNSFVFSLIVRKLLASRCKWAWWHSFRNNSRWSLVIVETCGRLSRSAKQYEKEWRVGYLKVWDEAAIPVTGDRRPRAWFLNFGTLKKRRWWIVTKCEP